MSHEFTFALDLNIHMDNKWSKIIILTKSVAAQARIHRQGRGDGNTERKRGMKVDNLDTD